MFRLLQWQIIRKYYFLEVDVMSDRKYFLMRSPANLVENSLLGYGWKKVDFSKSIDFKNLLDEIKDKYGSYGRKKNQVRRFFELKHGDVVVVPMKGSVVIGIVEGGKSYDTSPKMGFNRVVVNFRCDNGELRKVSTRTNVITNKLLSRLRVRQTNVSLKGFSSEIENLLKLGCKKNDRLVDLLEDKISAAEDEFKQALLNKLKTGDDLWIKGGGDGFEELIGELLKLEGFSSRVLSKKSNKGKGDIDIEAIKEDFWGQTQLVIQAKHHKGVSSIKALHQVVTAIANDEVDTNAIPMVISTGVFNEETIKEAEKQGVILMDGDSFIDWLYRNLSKLSAETRLKLGVSNVPCLI